MSISSIVKRVQAGKDQLITPRIDAYLVNHPEGIRLDVEHLKELTRMLYDTANSDRSKRLGASSAGNCERAQVFQYLGMPGLKTYDPVQQNLFNDGTWRHLRWQMMGLVSGALTHVESTYRKDARRLVVHLDGENKDEGWGFELKGTSVLYKFQQELPRNYMLQVHRMMLATGYERFSFVAEDKRTQNWVEWVIQANKAMLVEVRRSLDVINDSIEDRRLPPVLPSCWSKKGEAWRACPYRHECLYQTDWPEESKWECH